MRHGHSPSTTEAHVAKDSLRPLSDQGRDDARRMAAELVKRGGAPGLILHSPLLRAVQTAAEASSVLGPGAVREVYAPRDNSRPSEDVLRELSARCASVDEVLAVGHQPQIGEVATLLADAVFEMRPATIVALELSPTPRVLWTLSPDQLT